MTFRGFDQAGFPASWQEAQTVAGFPQEVFFEDDLAKVIDDVGNHHRKTSGFEEVIAQDDHFFFARIHDADTWDFTPRLMDQL
jgi:hypothetical protein